MPAVLMNNPFNGSAFKHRFRGLICCTAKLYGIDISKNAAESITRNLVSGDLYDQVFSEKKMLQYAKRNDVIRQFISFVGVGGIATLIHYIIYIGLVELTGIAPYISTGIGYFLSSFVNYYLNYLYTFRSDKDHRETMIKFYMIAGIGFFLNSGIVKFATEDFALNYLVSQVAATGIVTIWNFTCNRFWTFREKK